jgi:sulfatase modifying factor 1
MKTKLHFLRIGLALLAGIHSVGAQTAQFFRIVGPTATTITAFNADGTIVWSGANPGATYQVQNASSLAGGTNWVDYVQLPVTNSVNTNLLVSFNPLAGMALIPAGSFTMGDSLDGEIDAMPTVTVNVSGFYIDKNLVTSNQWAGVYSYATSHGYVFVGAAAGKATNDPVQTVDWYDCVKWSNARSQQAGLTPVYYTDAGFTQVFTNGENSTNVFANWGANGYRLPTEAEWEKAARGGLSGQRFPWGDTISETQANYDSSSNEFEPYDLGPPGPNSVGLIGGIPYTSLVGSFPASRYGLYDITGNVCEWCWDWYAGPPYPTGSPYLGGTDPRGPVGPLSGRRVLRGGCWHYDAFSATCAARNFNAPISLFNFFGFRCVRGL